MKEKIFYLEIGLDSELDFKMIKKKLFLKSLEFKWNFGIIIFDIKIEIFYQIFLGIISGFDVYILKKENKYIF